MRPSAPLLVAAGICLVIGGFLYDLMFAGIPYPDPTPELSGAYDSHAQIAAALRWAGAALLAAGCVWAIFRRSGPREPGHRAGAGAWAWLWAIFAAYMTCTLAAGAVFLSADICPEPAEPASLASAVMLLAAPSRAFFTAGLVLVSAGTSNLTFALVVLAVLLFLLAMLVTPAWLALRDARAGRWVSWPTALMLLTLAGLSAISTLLLCGSLTA